jgi:hypothetical protein
MNSAFSFSFPSPRLLHPCEMIALTPHVRSVDKMMFVMEAGSSITILPKPMYRAEAQLEEIPQYRARANIGALPEKRNCKHLPL